MNAQDLTYFRRKGAAKEFGTQFEYKVTAVVYLRALKFTHSFKLATNAEYAGDFDDIVLEYELSGKKSLLMVQLKHKERIGFTVDRQALASPSGAFSLKKYFKSYCEMKKDSALANKLENAHLVLFTNAAVNLPPSNSVKGLHPTVENILSTRGNLGHMSRIDINDDVCALIKDEGEAIEFLKKFLVFSEQASIKHTEILIKQEIMRFDGRISNEIHSLYNFFLNNVETWWKINGESSYLSEIWEGWVKSPIIIERHRMIMSRIKFFHESVHMLRKCMNASTCRIIEVIYDGVCCQLRTLKVLQALDSLSDTKHLFISADQPETDIYMVLNMWSEGWCDNLAVDMAELTDPVRKDLLSSKLSHILETYMNKKLILVSDGSDCSMLHCMKEKFTDNWDTYTDTCTFHQLDVESQRLVMEHKILLQGSEIKLGSLNQHYLFDSNIPWNMSDFLLSNNTPTLGVTLNESDYIIQRTLHQEVLIKKEIFVSNEIHDIFFITGTTIDKMKILVPPGEIVCDYKYRKFNARFLVCNYASKHFKLKTIYSNIPLHWLHKHNGQFYWKESCGNTKTLHKYIETSLRGKEDILSLIDNCKTCSPDVESLVRAELQTVVVTGEPGMGKSVLLSHVAYVMKQLFKSYWILKINLNDIVNDLANMSLSSVTEENVYRILEITAEVNKSTCPKLASILLRESLRKTGNVCVLIDSFDEISPTYEAIVFKILRILVQNLNLSTLWVASRHVLQYNLESNLATKCFILQPFTAEDQYNLLVHCWGNEIGENMLKQISAKILSIDGGYMSHVPLHLMMLTQVYQDLIKTEKCIELSDALTPYELYTRFIHMKFELFFKKAGMDVNNPCTKELLKLQLDLMLERHMLCALDTLNILPNLSIQQQQKITKKLQEHKEEITLGKEKCGIIDGITNDKPHFIHRILAECFAAMWLATFIEDNLCYILKMHFETGFEAIEQIFDHILACGHPFHTAVLNTNPNELGVCLLQHQKAVNEVDRGGRTALHLAAKCHSQLGVKMTELLLKNGADKDAKDKILGCTPIYYAAEACCWENVKLLLHAGARVLNNMAHHDLVKDVIKKSLQIHYIKSNDALTEQFEINWPIFDQQRSILHLAVLCKNIKCLSILLQFHPQKEISQQMQENLYSDKKIDVELKDSYGRTALYLAVQNNVYDAVEILLDELNADTTVTNTDLKTPLHIAVKMKNYDTVKLLLKHGANTNAVDKYGNTPLHIAACEGLTNCIKLLLDYGASTTVTNKNNETPYDYGVKESVKVMLSHRLSITMTSKYGDTPLHIATRYNHIQKVIFLLKQGIDTNAADKDGNTALHIAVREQYSEILKVLLEHGADTEVTDAYGDTPLHIAARYQLLGLVEQLLKFEADIEAKNQFGESPLHSAARRQNPEVIKLLLDHGANGSVADMKGYTPLQIACRWGTSETVNVIMNYGANTRMTNSYGDTALHIAARWNKTDIITELLKRDTETEIIDMNGNTSLHIAVTWNCYEGVKHLLKHGANTKVKNQDGDTPLLIAVSGQDSKFVKLLLEHLADTAVTNKEGDTTLHIAVRRQCSEIVRHLLRHHANVTSKNKDGDTPLLIAARGQNSQIVKVLLEYHANTTVTDKNSDTALHIAIRGQNYESVKYLLQYSADTTVVDKNGNTPLHLAVKNLFSGIVICLIQYGANTKAKDRNGDIPLHIAIREMCCEVVKPLLKDRSDLTITDKNGDAPIHIATRMQCLEIFKLVLEQNPDLTALDKNGDTPLHIAVKIQFVESVQLMLQHEINDTILDKKGDAVLHIAIKNKCFAIVNLMVLHKLDIINVDKNGDTPLHIAVKENSVEIVTLLLENDASLTELDKYGNSPLHIAIKLKCVEIVNFMLEHGADVNMKNKNGDTPLHLAIKSRCNEVLELLLEHDADSAIVDKDGNTPLQIAEREQFTELVELFQKSVNTAQVGNIMFDLYTRIYDYWWGTS